MSGLDKLLLFVLWVFSIIALWLAVVLVSGFGDMVGWWDYADRCTPKQALAFCWTGESDRTG